ncbi:MtrAB system histidine kinase MtrB [Corynebacterium camporealensis]
MLDRLQRARDSVVDSWRTSLQTRVIGLILIASTVVMVILAYALISVLTHRLVDQKINAAGQEIERARVTVEQQINATGTANSVQVRINSARASLGQLTTQTSETQAVFEPVILVPNADGSVTTSPEGYRIPENMRQLVADGNVAYQFTGIDQADGRDYQALVMGTPVDSDIPNTQMYLVLSMQSEASTMALMRGLLSAAGVVVVVLLVGIAWLATQQVITPIRSASRIAQRLAAGHLRERMVVDSDDEMGRLASSFNDMADKLSKQITQLEEYGDLQRQFTSDVSHELRTPLTTVRMAADMIASDPDSLEPHARRASELMTRELDRFEELLADLLEISRHDAGVADLSIATIDVRSCVESAWGQVTHLAQELGVEVNFNLPDEPVNMNGDSRRIERILRNLLANAIDHSEGKPVTVDMVASDDAVGIAVTDQGVGLKDGQEELVFNRFWRADASRKRHSGGTGLGLAIAREDAVLHGGTLDAKGYIGVGSRFRLLLPREPNTIFDDEPIALEVPHAPKAIAQAAEQTDTEPVANQDGEPTPQADAIAVTPDPGIVWPSERQGQPTERQGQFKKPKTGTGIHGEDPDFDEEAQR